MSCFKTGNSGKEHRNNKPPTTQRAGERSKRDTTCLTTSHNPPLWHPSWLSDDNPETNPINIKPETSSQVAEQFTWVPLPYCSPPGCPFPVKSLALSANVSPQTFPSVRQEPTFEPWKGSPFWQEDLEFAYLCLCPHYTYEISLLLKKYYYNLI